MSTDDHLRARRRIDAHFAGEPTDETAMRAHVTECEPCRAYYGRHQLLASLDPRSLSRRERLGRSMGAKSRSWLRPFYIAVPAAAALALFVHLKRDAGYTARGGGVVSSSEVQAFHKAGRVKDRIGTHDELAFSYRNPTGKKRLMIFGVDAHRRVYWYHPAWIDPKASPSAVAIIADDRSHELPEAIAQSIDDERVTIYGLFTDRSPTVRDIEDRLGKNAMPIENGDLLTALELAVGP